MFFKGERADSSDPKAANGKVHGGCYIPGIKVVTINRKVELFYNIIR